MTRGNGRVLFFIPAERRIRRDVKAKQCSYTAGEVIKIKE